jgi:Ca2+-binding RTX toxin-like protein
MTMTIFIGTDLDDTITRQKVSPGVTSNGAAAPSTQPDLLDGRAGDDVLDGGGGADTLLGGTGSDVLLWSTGGGSDLVDGGADADVVRVNGSEAADILTVVRAKAGKPAHALVSDGISGDAADLAHVERITLATLGGADTIEVEDLTDTDVDRIDIDLTVKGLGDGQADRVTITGSAEDDDLTLTVSPNGLLITGGAGAPTVNVIGTEVLDRVVLNGGDGADLMEAHGSGVFVLEGGAGDDTLIWASGDQTFDGGDGFDTVRASFEDGFGAVRVLDGRLQLGNLFAPGRLDTESVERVVVSASRGGALRIDDFTGSTVREVVIELDGAGGDADLILLAGPDSAVAITVSDVANVTTLIGLTAEISVTNLKAEDSLALNLGGGDDLVDASASTGTLIYFTGGGGDTVRGGAAADGIFGSEGDDSISGGGGDDQLDGEGGNNVLVGDGGRDIFQFFDSASHNVILDFEAHDATGFRDRLFLGVGVNTLADLKAEGLIAQVGDDVVINIGLEGTLTLKNLLLGSLDAGDFF